MRHSFEPSRLLLGVLVLAAGVLSLLQTHGAWSAPPWVPAAMVPAAVLVVGVLAWLTRLVWGWCGPRQREREAPPLD